MYLMYGHVDRLTENELIPYIGYQINQSLLTGVLAVSWYPPNDADNEGKNPDKLIPLILDLADKYQLKVKLIKLFTSIYNYVQAKRHSYLLVLIFEFI